MTTNIVGCEPDDVFIGMEVEVEFEDYDGVWLPYFHSVSPGGPTAAAAVGA